MSARNENQDGTRLPTTISPSAYHITLATDLAEERFEGVVSIDVECAEATSTIILNSSGLTINRAAVSADGVEQKCRSVADDATELLRLTSENEIGPGPATVTIEFSGRLQESLVGFYLSRFTDDDGTTHKLATTQFQAPYARRCFPCWDEPSFKATFAASLIVDPDSMAVTNGAEVGRTVLEDGPHRGRVRVDFAPTVPMSTYLVAFVIGNLEATDPVDVDGVALRVVHPPGSSHLTSFALEAGAFALRYFRNYFGLDYPGDKLDLVAIPDFAFGAMENLGCVTFREALLLIDPNRSTKDELQRVADVINHEIAHMWFGDLVTMKWWNGIWLNEAFATFMEMKCTDAFRPDWDRWTDFGLSLTTAYRTDSLLSTRPIEYEVVTPSDAEGMFDVLTYEKGAAVVRMLEQHLGEGTFQDGIRLYMEAHKFGNAETTDLWDAIEQSSGAPVRETMDTWIFQGGHPTIDIERDGDDIALAQSCAVPIGSIPEGEVAGVEGEAQTRALAEKAERAADQRWSVPFAYRIQPDEGEPRVERFLFTERHALSTAEDSDEATFVANADGSGFYRTSYDTETLDELAAVATERMKPVERYGLVDGTWSGVLTGRYSTPVFLNLLEALTAETDRSVWVRMIKGFADLRHLVDGEAADRLAEIAHDAMAPTLAGLGLTPIDGEEAGQRALRADLIRAMGVEARDPEIIDEAKRTVSVGRRDPELVDTAIMAAAVAVVAHTGDEVDFNDFQESSRRAKTPQEELRYLYALADFPDPELVARLYPLCLDGSIRSQNAPSLLGRAVHNPNSRRPTWAFITENFEQLNSIFATSLVTRMLDAASALDRVDEYGPVKEFLSRDSIPTGDRKLEQILENQRINIALRQREAPVLRQFLIG